MMSRLSLLLLFAKTCLCITCDEALQTSEEHDWSAEQLRSMVPEEVDKCLAQLGKKPIDLPNAKIIWDSLLLFYDGASNIPQDRLSLLHWITVAIEPREYENITFDSIDIIENFGLYYDLSPEQISAIAERVREDWGGKQPFDYSYYDLIALRQIICGFNRTEVEMIHPSAYREAASALSSLKNCPPEVLEGLATLATDELAYGSPSTWTANAATAVGVVMDGLPPELYQQIPPLVIKIVSEKMSKE